LQREYRNQNSLLTTVRKLQPGESTFLGGKKMITHGGLGDKSGQLFWSDADLWSVVKIADQDAADADFQVQCGMLDSGEVESLSL